MQVLAVPGEVVHTAQFHTPPKKDKETRKAWNIQFLCGGICPLSHQFLGAADVLFLFSYC
jgi:hypothetical protein